jgi:hypothetical protein
MMNTPYFPPWRPRLAAMGSTIQRLRQQSLHHLEKLFASFIPAHLLAQADEGPNSRDGIYTLRRTFFGFLSQVLSPGTPCREIVRQIQALFILQGGRAVDEGTSAYCQARGRLPEETLAQVRRTVATHVDQAAGRWHGFCPKVIDGTGVSLPDTGENQLVYPQPGGQKPGCGFPSLKLVGVFSLFTGALLDYAKGNKHQHELTLLQSLLAGFKPKDLALADRGFSCFVLIALFLMRQVQCVFRLHQARPQDMRRGKRLGKNDRLVTWAKPKEKPRYLPKSIWKRICSALTVRVIRCQLRTKGYRPQAVTLVTTLLDPQAYPAYELALLYARRWQIELWFDDLKTSMGMDVLRCQIPERVHKELEMFFIAYNLIRGLMVQASVLHDAPLERLSFKGTADALRQFSVAIAQARSQKKQKELIAQLLVVIARDQVPERPGRREPRALKRRPKPYALLKCSRIKFKEIIHRGRYRKLTPKNSAIN